MNELVSVIVPLYNSEKFIGSCIEHLLKQTYENIEIILINDGSYDSSEHICKQYNANDARIKYKKQNNKGQGAARNAGLELAEGEYVIFCDSDDYIPENGIEVLMMHKDEADLIVGGLEKIEHKKLIYHLPIPQIVTDPKAIARSLIEQMYCLNTPVNKLYRKSIIRDQHISFNNFKYGQDTCFVYEYIKHVKSICFIAEIIYHVNVVPGSMSLRRVINPWEYMRHIYELGVAIVPTGDDKSDYCLFLRSIKTALLLELRNGRESFYASVGEINKYINDNAIKYQKYYGIYNSIIYCLIKYNRRLALYIILWIRNSFL